MNARDTGGSITSSSAYLAGGFCVYAVRVVDCVRSQCVTLLCQLPKRFGYRVSERTRMANGYTKCVDLASATSWPRWRRCGRVYYSIIGAPKETRRRRYLATKGRHGDPCPRWRQRKPAIRKINSPTEHLQPAEQEAGKSWRKHKTTYDRQLPAGWKMETATHCLKLGCGSDIRNTNDRGVKQHCEVAGLLDGMFPTRHQVDKGQIICGVFRQFKFYFLKFVLWWFSVYTFCLFFSLIK